MKVKLTKYDCFNKNIPVDTIMEVIPGMEADASDVFNILTGMCYLCKTPSGELKYFLATDVEIVEGNSIDWEQRRYEIAKEITAALAANPYEQIVKADGKQLSKWGIEITDALIKELKKKEYGTMREISGT